MNTGSGNEDSTATQVFIGRRLRGGESQLGRATCGGRPYTRPSGCTAGSLGVKSQRRTISP
jgi:hypothetical protein